jgi:hypothetical protein
MVRTDPFQCLDLFPMLFVNSHVELLKLNQKIDNVVPSNSLLFLFLLKEKLAER